ncbi:MAG: hypothetical protein J6C32_04525 [Eubacterium sp.]|nr:hypothetical protein [Eubacterium sp.]
MGLAGAMSDVSNYMGKREYIYSKNRDSSHGDRASQKGNAVRDLFFELVQEEREELEERIKSGDSEPRYQIGASSFTETEWKKLIKSVDDVQEEMRKAAERERELQKEMQQKKEVQESKLCIIVYDADGIRCVEAETGICRWFIKFTDNTQYSKVKEYMDGMAADSSPALPLNEGFWQGLLLS